MRNVKINMTINNLTYFLIELPFYETVIILFYGVFLLYETTLIFLYILLLFGFHNHAPITCIIFSDFMLSTKQVDVFWHIIILGYVKLNRDTSVYFSKSVIKIISVWNYQFNKISFAKIVNIIRKWIRGTLVYLFSYP